MKPIYHIWRQLSRTDLIVLQLIQDLERPYQKQIATILNLDPSQVRRAAANLIKAGLIEMVKNGRRVIYVSKADAQMSAFDEKQRTSRCPVSSSTTTLSNLKTNTNTSSSTTRKYRTPDHQTSGIDPITDLRQLALIEPVQDQNLGTLDIPSQAILDLETLAINKDLTQSFDSAPDLTRKFSPAKILMHFDSDGVIAANLATWAEAHRKSCLDSSNLTAALTWVKIVEGQSPRLINTDSESIRDSSPMTTAETIIDQAFAESVVVNVQPSVAFEGNTLPDHIPQHTRTSPINLQLAENPIAESSPVSALDQPLKPPKLKPKLTTIDNAQSGTSDNLAEIWSEILQHLATSTTKFVFEQRLKQTRLLSMNDQRLVIDATCETNRHWLAGRLRQVVERATSRVIGMVSEIEFVVAPSG